METHQCANQQCMTRQSPDGMFHHTPYAKERGDSFLCSHDCWHKWREVNPPRFANRTAWSHQAT